jgi:hypothetical protein
MRPGPSRAEPLAAGSGKIGGAADRRLGSVGDGFFRPEKNSKYLLRKRASLLVCVPPFDLVGQTGCKLLDQANANN